MKRGKKLIKKLLAPRYAKINAKALAFAGGVLFGVSVIITTLLTSIWGLFPSYTGLLIDVYGFLGYSATPGGAFLGGIYGFVDGFIGLYILGWLYNKFL